MIGLHPEDIERIPVALPNALTKERIAEVASFLEATADKMETGPSLTDVLIEEVLAWGAGRSLALALVQDWCIFTATHPADAPVGNEDVPAPMLNFVIEALRPVIGRPAVEDMSPRSIRRHVAQARKRFIRNLEQIYG